MRQCVYFKDFRGRCDMQRVSALFVGGLAALCGCVSASADCIALLPPKGSYSHRPIYEVVSCGPAEPVVELLRQSNPAKFGTFSYAEGDVAITVKAANSDARKLMWQETEIWYYPSGCAGVRAGMRFLRPKLSELCCDVWPVNTLPCGVGGRQLMVLKSHDGA